MPDTENPLADAHTAYPSLTGRRVLVTGGTMVSHIRVETRLDHP